MAWKYVQRNTETGQERTTSSGGGGGSSTLASLDDVNFSNPTDGQIMQYDAQNSKWVNVDLSGGGHVYSTNEQEIGTLYDVKKLYEKTYKIINYILFQTVT